MSHTPGPWLTHREGFSTVYVEARIGGGLVQEVAACGPTQNHGQQEANATLIAAAPDMADALKDARDCVLSCLNAEESATRPDLERSEYFRDLLTRVDFALVKAGVS